MFDLLYPADLQKIDCEGEVFPIIDNSGNVIGSALRKECHSGKQLLHPVVHLHIFDSNGRLYLQQRSLKKDIQPGKWDTSVGGHIDFGEGVLQALAREAREELGVYGIGESIEPIELFHYVWSSKLEEEMINAFAILYDGPLAPDHDEVTQGRFWTLQDLKTSLGKDLFTPQFEQELPRLLELPIVQCLFKI